jgi:8-oxo-dGTP pyrophosphatase MutT (NUDIX family)
LYFFREVLEETGFDITDRLDPDEYIGKSMPIVSRDAPDIRPFLYFIRPDTGFVMPDIRPDTGTGY